MAQSQNRSPLIAVAFELLGRGVHQAGLLFHLRLLADQARLVLGQQALDLRDLPLPVTELLPECDHREAVLAFIESELGYWGPYWAFTMFAIVFVLGGQLMKPERKEE